MRIPAVPFGPAVPLLAAGLAGIFFCAALTGCGEWKGFSSPGDTVLLWDGKIPVVEVVDELGVVGAQFPDDPFELTVAETITPASPLKATLIRGTLDPFKPLTLGNELAASCGEQSGVRGVYEGDVDWVRIAHPGEFLCLVLDAEAVPGVEILWDIVAFSFEPGCSDCQGNPCLSGPFLTDAVELVGQAGQEPVLAPLSIPPGEANAVFTAGPKEIALYVAAASGDYGPQTQAVPYALYLLPRRMGSPSCEGLRPNHFVSEQ